MFAALREKIFGQKASKSLAKSRLHFVLVQDRTGLNNDELAGFKEEMVNVIEKYFVIDKTGFDISYKRNGETTTLFINSPIIVKRQETPDNDVGARKRKRKLSGSVVTERTVTQRTETEIDAAKIAPSDTISAEETTEGLDRAETVVASTDSDPLARI